MKKILILGAIIAGIITAGIWYYSDEKVVVRKSNKLLECFEKTEGDGLLSNVLSEDNFRDLLDTEVSLDFDHKDMPDLKGGIKQDRDHLARNYLYMMRAVKHLKLTNQNIELLDITDNTAKVKITFRGEAKYSRKKVDADIHLRLDYKKTDEGWRISRITVKQET